MRISSLNRLAKIESLESRVCLTADFAGLDLFAQLPVDPVSSYPSQFVRAGDYAYFQAGSDSLYRTDGTTGGTSNLPFHEGIRYPIAFGDEIVFGASDSHIYRTDRLNNSVIRTTVDGQIVQSRPWLFNNEIYFVGRDSEPGGQLGLMRTDGTQDSAAFVSVPGIDKTNSVILGVWNDRLHFRFHDGQDRLFAVDRAGEVTEIAANGVPARFRVAGSIGGIVIGADSDSLHFIDTENGYSIDQFDPGQGREIRGDFVSVDGRNLLFCHS